MSEGSCNIFLFKELDFLVNLSPQCFKRLFFLLGERNFLILFETSEWLMANFYDFRVRKQKASITSSYTTWSVSNKKSTYLEAQ